MGFQQVFGSWDRPYEGVEITYRSFPPDLTENLWGYGYFMQAAMGLRGCTPLAGANMQAGATNGDGRRRDASYGYGAGAQRPCLR